MGHSHAPKSSQNGSLSELEELYLLEMSRVVGFRV